MSVYKKKSALNAKSDTKDSRKNKTNVEKLSEFPLWENPTIKNCKCHKFIIYMFITNHNHEIIVFLEAKNWYDMCRNGQNSAKREIVFAKKKNK